jgi:hypothetical protein
MQPAAARTGTVSLARADVVSHVHRARQQAVRWMLISVSGQFPDPIIEMGEYRRSPNPIERRLPGTKRSEPGVDAGQSKEAA